MKNIRLIIMLCVPLLWLAGCDKNDLEPVGPGGGTGIVGDIKFEIGLSPLTRVATDEDFKSAWEDGDQIGIFAVKRSGGTPGTLAATGNYIHNVKLTYNAGTWSADAGVEIWWPRDDTPLDFYAYFPYDDNGGSSLSLDPAAIAFTVEADQRGTTVIGGTGVPNYNLSELMSASADNSGTGYTVTQTVQLTFKHSLALVQVAVYGKDFDAEKFSVTLNGVETGAKLDLGAAGGPKAVAEGSTVDVSMALSHKRNSPVEYVFRALVPAQEIEQGGMLFNIIYDGTVYTGATLASPLQLEAGRAHLYSRNINVNGIFTAAELVGFSADWNAASDATTRGAVLEKWSVEGTAAGTVMLWANLDMSEVGDFTPIGNNSNPFTGTFDGNGYTISGLTVEVTGDYAGLFGYNSGTVRNIILENCEITATGNFAGGIAGFNFNGTITGCEMNGGTVTAQTNFAGGIAGWNEYGTISGCQITGGEVKAGQDYAGGIAGGNNDLIENCTVSGTAKIEAESNTGGIAGLNDLATISGCQMTGGQVTATQSCAGGIVGKNSSSAITGCKMTGGEVKATQDYAGGIAGWNDGGTITGCEMTEGTVTANNENAGGITGLNNGNSAKIENCTVSATAKIEANRNAGSIAGFNLNGTITDCEMTGGTVTATLSRAGGIAGYNDGSTAKIENCTVSGSAEIEAQNYAGGIVGWNSSGTITVCQMTGGEVKATQNYAGGIAGNNVYPGFGTAEIENCTVSGTAKIEAQNNAGGIAGNNEGGTITGCEMTGGTVTATQNYAGGIAGDNLDGTITGCKMTGGTVTADNQYAGGIAGDNLDGTITGCQMTGGEVTATQNYAGGIAGDNNGTSPKIETCTVAGTAKIAAQDYTGGIAGWNMNGAITACISAPEAIAGTSEVGVVTGNNRGTVNSCYWAKDVVLGDPAVGNGIPADRGGSFDKASVPHPALFFITGNPTPIADMNSAIQSAGSDWHWQPGDATTGWYPIAYKL